MAVSARRPRFATVSPLEFGRIGGIIGWENLGGCMSDITILHRKDRFAVSRHGNATVMDQEHVPIATGRTG